MFEESKRKHKVALEKMRKAGLTNEVLAEKLKAMSNFLKK